MAMTPPSPTAGAAPLPPQAAPPGAPPQRQPLPQPVNEPGPPLSRLPLHAGDQTLAPPAPNVQFTNDAIEKLSEQDWAALSQDLYNSVNASITSRSAFEANLKEWSDAYDMILSRTEKDMPFEDASNITMPYTAAQLESLVAYIAGTVLQPRLYIVTGNTPQAADDAFKIEKYYNAEYLRLRSDGSSYFSRHLDWIHMSLRDGTCVLEVLWNRRRQRKRSKAYAPKIDPQTGIGQLDANGNPVWEPIFQDVDVFVKDYAELTPVRIKEFGLIPSESPSIEAAAACWRVEWLYEDQLDRMVRRGTMDSDEVEKALLQVPTGATEVSSDMQGTYDKNASQQIGIGQGQGSLTSRFFKNRGPIKVFRVHSREYDMNGDGIPEENIFWIGWQTQRMLGWTPYDYGNQTQRPFFSFCPFPRPDEFLGFSIIERLAGIQMDIDSIKNNRRDQIELRLNPPMRVTPGSELLNKKGIWGPGRMIEVAQGDFELLTMEDVPMSSFQEEQVDKSYGSDYTGLSQPMIGVQSSGRRSATELKQQSAAAGTRLNIICTRFRISAGQVINFVHTLNKQYLMNAPQTIVDQQLYTLPLDVLSQDITIGIAGATDPIDSTTRRNETMSMYQLMAGAPDLAQDPMKRFYWRRAVLETFGRADIAQLIGTEQDAQQEKQQMAQAAAAQAQQAQAASAAASATSPTPGALPQPSQQPQRPPTR